VFFNLFFETEPFAAILIAHGIQGLSQKFVWGKIVKFESTEEVLGKGASKLKSDWGSAVCSPSGGRADPRPLAYLGCT